jgi:aminoglycoside phosphotransferase
MAGVLYETVQALHPRAKRVPSAPEVPLGFRAVLAAPQWLRHSGPGVAGIADCPGACRIRVAAKPVGGFGAVSGLPGPFTTLARQVAGEITEVTDCSWQRDSSAVWRLASASRGCWYLKRHSSGRFHAREVAALQSWAHVLGPGRVPGLAAADPGLLIMVITAVPGQPVSGFRLSAGEEQEVHRQAGLLLGRLHATAREPEAGADISRMASRVDGHLQDACELLTPAQRQMVRECAGRLARLGPRVPAVASHKDFQPRNWLWDPAGGQLGVIRRCPVRGHRPERPRAPELHAAGRGVEGSRGLQACCGFRGTVGLAAAWRADGDLVRAAAWPVSGRRLTWRVPGAGIGGLAERHAQGTGYRLVSRPRACVMPAAPYGAGLARRAACGRAVKFMLPWTVSGAGSAGTSRTAAPRSRCRAPSDVTVRVGRLPRPDPPVGQRAVKLIGEQCRVPVGAGVEFRPLQHIVWIDLLRQRYARAWRVGPVRRQKEVHVTALNRASAQRLC